MYVCMYVYIYTHIIVVYTYILFCVTIPEYSTGKVA